MKRQHFSRLKLRSAWIFAFSLLNSFQFSDRLRIPRRVFTLPERHVKDNRGAFENSKSRKSSEQSLSFDLRQCLNTVSYVYRRAAEKSIICTSEINAAHLYSLWASFPRNTGRQMCSTFFWLCVHTRLCCLMEQMTTVAGGSANRPGMARPVYCYMIKVPMKA